MKFLILFAFLFGAANALVPGGKIFNGQPGTQSNFPYMASIKNSNGSLVCGAVILSSRWVLTAAHCNLPSLYWVGVGNVNLYQQINYVIDLTVPYSGYDQDDRVGDILLVKTKIRIDMTAGVVSTISINSNSLNDLTLTTSMVTAGWGFSNSPNPNTLMFAPYTTQSQAYCWEKSNQGNVPIPYSAEISLCAIGSQSTPVYPVTICSGDTGGPLVYNNVVYGIASRLMMSPCPANVMLPDVFTRVSYYYSWIYSIINGNVGGTP